MRRSTVMLRFPRLEISMYGFGVESSVLSEPPSARCGSPPGGSTLTTSAPRSAMIAPAPGTNVHAATSSTRTPSNGPLTATCLPDLNEVFLARDHSATHWTGWLGFAHRRSAVRYRPRPLGSLGAPGDPRRQQDCVNGSLR